jgi:hypothetical protein
MNRFVLALALAACASAHAEITPPSGISPRLAASPNEVPSFALRGEGDHLFECRQVAANPDRFAWSFTAPDATLYDQGRPVGRHVQMNVWESTTDRTSVSGAMRSRQDAGTGNLPWALFRGVASPEGGIFAGVTSVQRVNTSGGVAPAAGCDADHVGQEARVAFKADFYFYKLRG